MVPGCWGSWSENNDVIGQKQLYWFLGDATKGKGNPALISAGVLHGEGTQPSDKPAYHFLSFSILLVAPLPCSPFLQDFHSGSDLTKILFSHAQNARRVHRCPCAPPRVSSVFLVLHVQYNKSKHNDHWSVS